MKFSYNYEKNALLLRDRGIGFEEIIRAIGSGGLLAIVDHPNLRKYPNQKLFYVYIMDEVYVVPCVQETGGVLFLKMLFPSRKARKLFLSH